MILSILDMGVRPAAGFFKRQKGTIRAWILVIPFSILAGIVMPLPAAADEPPLPTQHRLTLQIRDGQGAPLEARVRVFGPDNRVHPDTLDSQRLYFWGGGGYCYSDGSFWVDVPTGASRVTVGRGFEWIPYNRTVYINRDTTLTVSLNRITNLRDEGWYSGDLHAHSNHPPIDYQITPLRARMIARAEDLAVIHLLDQSYNFTGAPNHVSDSATVVYYSFEYRNQAYGHVPLPGLRNNVAYGCCLDPAPAYPMLLDLRNEVVPAKGPMIVLGHPHTTDDYFYDGGWPGAGLGRELPVLAALGAIDALDVLSYGNDPFEDWQEWYDILSSGLPCPPSAGTDCRLCSTSSLPVGGFRVYADLGEGADLDYDAWVEALRAGRTFVTNYPLIPEFDVDGHAAGETIEISGDSLHAQVHVRAICALGLRRISIIAEGNEVWSISLEGQVPPQTVYDGLIGLQIPAPAWLLVNVEGLTGNHHAVTGPPQAQTSPVRFTRGGTPIRRTLASARWLDSISMLKTFVTERGNWEQFWHRDSVMARIRRAEDYYKGAFVLPPDPFPLLAPTDSDTVFTGELFISWGAALDPEPGDRVRYTVLIATDSLMTLPRMFLTDTPGLDNPVLQPNRWYWWKVTALDRANNQRVGTPPLEKFYLAVNTSGVADHTPLLNPAVAPNPSAGPVRLTGFGGAVSIYDSSGRRVASSSAGLRRTDGGWIWNGRIRGRPAPAGLYWAVGSEGGPAVRLIRLH